MIISIHKKILSDAVGVVSKFSERKVLSLPALSAIAFSAENGTLTLRATNLETGIEMKTDAVIKKEGTVALPASIVRDITSSFSGDGMVTIESSGDTVTIKTEKGTSTLKTLPYEDVPTLGIPEGTKATGTISGVLFRSLIGSVASYASTSTVRPELASILVSSEGGMIKAVATDSFRLAEKKASLQGSITPFTLLIPAKNAMDIVSHIPDTDVSIIANEHQCVLSWGGTVVTTRLVAMSYPDYQQIIPKSYTAELTVLKRDFETALKRTAVFSDSFQKVRVALDAGKKTITLSAHNPDVGETTEEMASSGTGEAIELSFNHRYLVAPLSSLVSESITLASSGIGRPLVIRPVGDSSFLYLVMPMNQ